MTKALRLQPTSLDARDTRAFIYLKVDEFAKATSEYGLALQADPNHARALYGRGLAKAKSGDKAGDARLGLLGEFFQQDSKSIPRINRALWRNFKALR